MKIDIIMVTYNSKKYIEKCFTSIVKSKYDLSNVGVYVCDNNSTDDSVNILNKVKNKYGNKFSEFKIIESKKNAGFGIGNNIASKYAKGDYLFFLNIDCEIYPDTLKDISENIFKYKNAGILELRQEPYEHPKYYNVITGETKWASGACMIMPTKLFRKVKGFDKKIFMYCEDVEISYHVRKLGYQIIYLNNVSIIHHSYSKPNEFKKSQYVNSAANNLYVRFKYGTIKDIIKGLGITLLFYREIGDNKDIKQEDLLTIKKEAKHNITKMFFRGVLAWFGRIRYIFNKYRVKFNFSGFDYSGVRDGAFYVPKKFSTKPLVSILVRTCGRPDTLRETLISIKNQTYKNIEIVIVEDGTSKSKEMIDKEFSDLNIKYYCFEKHVGRCVAGNKALELASGKYLNFLDDDDLFYNDHVEVLVGELENSSNMVAYATSFETPIVVSSRTPYVYKELDEYVLLSVEYNILKLLYSNITPIQCVMFNREVYEKCGGFDVKLDALEDWDLWIRYALKYPFKFVKKTTSIYRVPGIREDVDKRTEFLTSYLDIVRSKYKNEKVDADMNDVIDFYQHIANLSSNPTAVRLAKIKKIIKGDK